VVTEVTVSPSFFKAATLNPSFNPSASGFPQQNPNAARPKRDGGRWGVVPASQHQEILVALASLIRAQRYDMALTILDSELGGGC